MASDQPFTSASDEAQYIYSRSVQLGLDPLAPLSIIPHEGGELPANTVGDNGTSFGPWQLHAGGALPSAVWAKGPDYANQWANSPVGIDYALGQQAKVARGLSGASAIHNIVFGFERPQNPTAEANASIATYQAVSSQAGPGPISTGGIGGGGWSTWWKLAQDALRLATPGGATPTNIGHGITDTQGVRGAVGNALGIPDWLTNPAGWLIRGLELVAGGVLVFAGVYLLAKQIGLAPDASSIPGPVGTVASVAE